MNGVCLAVPWAWHVSPRVTCIQCELLVIFCEMLGFGTKRQ